LKPEQELHRRLHDLEVPDRLHYSPTAWVAATYLNSWSSFEAGAYPEASYRKGRDGKVHLRGLVKHAVLANEKTIFTLPTGFRPVRREIFVVLSAIGGTQTAGRIDVTSSGEVIPLGFSGLEMTYLSLAGVSFFTD
jgi:hypothetical protein